MITCPNFNDNLLYNKAVTDTSINGKVVPAMSFSKASIAATLPSTIEELPVLTCSSDGAVTYSSSDATVLTVNASTGAITLVAAGSANVIAKSAETMKNYANEAKYAVTVSAAPVNE